MSPDRRIETLLDLISQVKKRPELYFGDRRISTLNTYLQGYQMATIVYNIQTDKVARHLMDFHHFVETKFNDTRTIGWSNLILENSNGDEELALQTFFDLFDEFAKTLD